MKANPPNARFWTYLQRGWVKITLRPGQTLTWRHFSRDDEGYSYENESWEHSGHEIQCRYEDGGRDCDGPIRHTGRAHCPLDQLAATPAYMEPECVDTQRLRKAGIFSFGNWRAPIFRGVRISGPAWVKGRSQTHDAYAEAAGY